MWRTAVCGSVGVVLFGAASAAAQDYTFVPVRGGAVSDIVFDQHQPNVVFAAVHGPGLYESKDGGATFEARPLPGVRPHSPRQVLASSAEAGVVLVCEPNVEGTLSSVKNVFRSEDTGETFSEVLSTGGDGCTAIAEGATAGTYYAASGESPDLFLFQSTDSGLTWTKTKLTVSGSVFGSSGYAIRTLAVLPSGRLVFALSDGGPDFDVPFFGGIAYSDDGTAATAAAGAGFIPSGLAFNGTDTLLDIADGSPEPRLLLSPDGAAFSGVPFADGSSRYSPYLTLRYAPSRDAFLTLSGDRVLQSASAADGYSFSDSRPLDGGGTAMHVTYYATMAPDPNDADGLLLGSAKGGDGIVRRSGSPASFSVAGGIGAARLDAALLDPASGYQYLASYTGRVLFADKGAASAREIFRGKFSNEEPVTALAYDLADPKHVVLGTMYGDGVSNQARLLELPDAVSAPDDPGNGTHPRWQRAADPVSPPVGQISALLVDGMTRYVGYDGGTGSGAGARLYRSRDGGATYESLPLRTDAAVCVVARDPSDKDVLYAGGGDVIAPNEAGTKGLFVSRDAGDTWSQVAPQPELARIQVRRVAFDRETPAHFWIAGTGYDSELWQTLDGGATFSEITPPGLELDIEDITYSSSLGRLVVARESGLYTHDPAVDGDWQLLTALYARPLALYPDARGAGTTAGLYVEDELAGVTGGGDPGAGGMNGGAGGGTDASGGSSGSAASSPMLTGGTNATGGTSATSAGAGGLGSGASAGTAGVSVAGAAMTGTSAAGNDGATSTSDGDGDGSSKKKHGGCGCSTSSDRSPASGASMLGLLGLFRRRARGRRLRKTAATGPVGRAKPCGRRACGR